MAAEAGEMVPMDRRLRQLAASLVCPKLDSSERQEHIAMLARWFYSTWREGAWLGFTDIEILPYRKLVRAISRTASRAEPAPGTLPLRLGR